MKINYPNGLIPFEQKFAVIAGTEFEAKFLGPMADVQEFAGSLGSQSGGTAPGQLGRVQLQELVEYWSAKYYSEMKLLGLFSEEIIDSIEVLWERVVHLLKIGSFSTGPQRGERLDLELLAASMQRVVFQQYTFDLDTMQAILLREPGESKDFFKNTARKAARKKLVDAEAARIRVYWRTLHYFICQFLQGATSITSPVSGATCNISTGIQVQTAAVTWATSTTNIISELADWVKSFIEENDGQRPTHMIVNHRFSLDYLLDNEELREAFAPYNIGIMTEDGLLKFLLSVVGLSGVEVIQMAEMKDDGGSSEGTFANLSHVWPRDKMALGLVIPGEDNLRLLTARTLDNDMMGGLSSYEEETKAPKRVAVHIHGNHVPVIRDPRRWKAYDLIP